eukprot:10879769-Ditylum_brightwellii.AAC.1
MENGPYYPSEFECDFVQSVHKFNTVSSAKSSGNTTAVVFAWLFAFVAIGAGAIAYNLYEKINRMNVNLAA